MKTKTFDNGLVVKHRKHAIILENKNGKKEKESHFEFKFEKNEFLKFVHYIKHISNEAWVKITPKEAHSCGSDYFEYYDRKYDDNGTLTLNVKTDNEYKLIVNAPYMSTDTLYQFNKPKIQSFIYDLNKHI